jgi:tetratricopeptide (TPR) repeat protein
VSNELNEQQELAQQLYQLGKVAFERGNYRQAIECLEKAVTLMPPGSRLSGESQLWLVTAYEATGMRQEAIALCAKVSRHPSPTVASQGRRVLYILKAPRLQLRPEWLTQIPDLGGLETGSRDEIVGKYQTKTKQSQKPKVKAEETIEDLSQMNTKDNQFVWVALGAIALTLGAFVWFK